MTGIDEETGVTYLSFSKATEDDEGNYICRITTEIGTAESAFTLVIEPGNCVCIVCMYVNVVVSYVWYQLYEHIANT